MDAPVGKHMLTLPCPVCWCIIPGEESEHLRGSGRTELISPNTKKFPIWNGSCWMTLFKQRDQLHQRPLNLEDPQPILYGPVHQIFPEESWRRFLFGCCQCSAAVPWETISTPTFSAISRAIVLIPTENQRQSLSRLEYPPCYTLTGQLNENK